jgi:hypothetical protein
VKYLILLAIVLMLPACATKYAYESGDTTFTVSSYREFKRIEVQYGTLHITASGVTDDTAEAAVAITTSIGDNAAETGQIWLKGGPLMDMTGRPRGATNAELAAQFKALETQ